MAENNCVVCFKNVRIYSVGECDHPVCYECSTRMRVLCRQNECPICRHEMSVVIFTDKVRPFRRLRRRYALYESKYHIAFENPEIEEMYRVLLQHSCNKCHKRIVFDSFEALIEHMRKSHDIFCCNLCVENLKIFPSEMRFYSKMDLNRHKRIGDVDDRSHRGHPLCEFCNIRYMDRDELYRHLRQMHLFCHICDSEGIQQFYGQYDMLRDHYRKDHFLCEEGDCIQETLTSVFPTELDLKAHRALVHCKNLRNKAAVKQARTLELEFHLAPRSRRPVHQEHSNEYMSIGQSSASCDTNEVNIMASLEQDFPSLTNEAPSSAPRPNKIIRQRNNRLAFDDQNFPALGSEANIRLNIVESRPSSSAPTSVRSTNISVQMKQKKANPKRAEEPLLAIAGPSTSTLSLTWVNKAKEKKPAPEKPTQAIPKPSESVPKPPMLSKKNFPKLINSGLVNGEVQESPKRNKKSSVAIHIDENDQMSMRNGDMPPAGKQRKAASSDGKSAGKSTNTENDDKTACFLLNASRKKVKMKGDENSQQSNVNTLPKGSLDGQLASGSRNPVSRCEKVVNLASQSTNCNNRNCDINILDKKTKKPKNNEKCDNQVPKDAEKKSSASGKGKENVVTNVKSDPRKHAQSNNKSSSSNVTKKERSFSQDTKPKSKTEEKKVDGVRKKSELNIGQLSVSESNVNGSLSKEQTVKKPPPGLSQPKLPVPPPGITPIAESNVPSIPSLIANPLFVYQQPENFTSRNSRLIKKITESLPKNSDEALNELKNTSLLFREGLLPAATFYRYCKEKFKKEDFDDIFTELIVLLPNIPKQQELLAIHAASSPVDSLFSRVHSCQICFQVISADDMLYHYSQHT